MIRVYRSLFMLSVYCGSSNGSVGTLVVLLYFVMAQDVIVEWRLY